MDYLSSIITLRSQKLVPSMKTNCLPNNATFHESLPSGCVLLDIERQKLKNGKWKLCEIALIHSDGEEHHQEPITVTNLNRVLDKIEQAEIIVGHNIRWHDIPKLYEYAKRQQPPELAAKICDTLELSCLFLIGKPQHKLNKLYRKQLKLNNPLKDAKESYAVYKNISEHDCDLPSIVRYWAWQLLPQGYPRNLIPELLGLEQRAWEKLQKHQPMLNIPALQNYLQGLPRHNIKNLGAVVFLNWLYQLNESEARRPNWLERNFPSFREAEKNAFPLPSDEDKLSDELEYFFGFKKFRPHQKEITQILLEGETVPLGILPTGGGKSIIFQLPALILSKYYRGLSIIVSPLQALMADQVQNLKDKLIKQERSEFAERVELLTGTQSLEEQRCVIEAVWNGQVDILYLSPERLRQPRIQRILKHRLPHLWVLDEAHTLSQWGYDFRPDFLRIAQNLQKFYKKRQQNNSIRWGFVTATATLKVIEDLEIAVKQLDGLCSSSLKRLPAGGKSFQWRNEITTHIEIVERPDSVNDIPDSQRLKKTIDYLKKQQKEHIKKYSNLGVAIVYVPTRRMAQKYSEELNKADFKTTYFHSRIPNKQQVIEDFKAEEIEVVVATNAFGMGIDRKGMHTVIHVAPPATPEAYLQEIGRLARDEGEKGSAYLFWHPDDFNWIFEQQGRSQISFKALRECWDVIRPLVRNKEEAWISCLDLAKPLGLEEPEDLEILETQARVAIYYLEKKELILEGESCPCYINICLKQELNLEDINQLSGDANKLASFLFDIGFIKPQMSIQIDLREVSLATEMSPASVINTLRKLVKLKLADWEYKIAFKFGKQYDKKLKQFKSSTQGFLEWLQSESPEIESEKSILLDVEVLKEQLDKLDKKVDIAYALKILAQLKLASYKKESRNTTRLFLKQEETLTQWLKLASQKCEEQWQHIDHVENILDKLFKDKKWKSEESQLLDLAELERYIDTHKYAELDLLKVLVFMQRLGVVVLGRGDVSNLMLYRLLPGERKNWSEGVYEPLNEHYKQRNERINIMRQVLETRMQGEKQLIQILEDYFTLSLDEFCQHYGKIGHNPPIVENILKNLNPTQQRIVTDDQSRALLVLAGPGSGKTHTIVSRVGYLVSARGIPPERILVLAYNRTAAAQVRKRLHKLLGKPGTLVDALTFHALATKLTKFKTNDVPQEIKGEARFRWLLEQAINHLQQQENHPGYQYILVDEYQDIDKLQYQMITKLAGFDRQDEDESQKSFLMAVGDDDQNLYEWNGASVEFIRRFRQDYQVPEDAVIPLTQNYRSRPAIVDFANCFIEKAIPPGKRLKGINERIQSVHTQEPGKVFWGEYRHLYDAAEWIADKIAEILTRPEEIYAEKIAVLAHRWEDLRFLQHALPEYWGNDQDMAYQLYNTKDDLRPIKSRVGQAILKRLREQPSLRVDNPQSHLEYLRQELGYSDRDAAWSALLQALSGCSQMTQEDIAYLLEEARPVQPGKVVLSTFHSAKGSEFSHVFVLEDGFVDKNQLESRARELYVGFTRAKEELYILGSNNKHSRHPILLDVLNSMNSPQSNQYIQNIQVDTVNLPPSIRYQWFLDPRDLFLSQQMIANEWGQKRIDAYAREWGQLNNNQVPYEISCNNLQNGNLSGGIVAILSQKGKEQLNKFLGANLCLAVKGHTVFRVERDDQFFLNVGQHPQEDHHYVVLPYFEVEEVF